MKHLIISILSLLATPLLAQQVTKVKPQPTSPPAAVHATLSHASAKAKAKAAALDKIVPELTGINNKAVSLRWNNPEAINGFFEDFEAHPDFQINSPGTIGWQYIDADNKDTYTWTAASFPHQAERMAFMVFNPSKTSPSTADYPDIKPYSGSKMLVDFTVDGGNNDFIISPELNFSSDFKISFRARSYKDTWGKERFKVGYSTTGSRPSDFTFVQSGDYEEAPTAWTLYEYTIPKDAKYVCINCVSNDAFIFMVDDIFVGTNKVRPRIASREASSEKSLAGFNLYRDDVKVNKELITSVTANDTVPDYATYNYKVQSVMSDGSLGESSDPLSVEVPDIRLLPFEDDFDRNTIDEDMWERPTDAQGRENKWHADYYPYGLVDYSACYSYSYSLGAYDQSLVSRELRTLSPEKTRLRFQLRLDNGPKYSGGFLHAEVTNDGGTTWKEIAKFENKEGSFDWRTYEYPLSSFLNGSELFRIRFRAEGDNAEYINYWFVDDIKVWNPNLHPVSIKATNAGQPVAGCVFTLTADNGAVYTDTTDAEGNISLPEMEEGTYSVVGELKGYNRFTAEWTLTADGPASFNAALTHPVLKLSEQTVNQTSAMEEQTSKVITLENTGDGDIHFNLYPTPEAGTGTADHRWNVTQAFDASGDVQSSVAFDGENFYTTSNFLLGKFYKYSRDGQFIEEFSVPGIYYILYDFTYDGNYFYASDRKNRIFQLDLRNRQLVKTIDIKSIPSLCVTHISYDPRSDQFWVGDFNTMCRVDRTGKVTVSLYKLNSSSSMGVIGTAFDNISEGGPYLWMADLSQTGFNTVDKVTLRQYDLNNRRFTNLTHSAVDIPGYKTGSLDTGENDLGGIEATTTLINGQLSLVGILQQSPSRIFVYNLADINPWLNVSQFAGDIKPGEKAEIRLDFDARHASLNETLNTTLQLRSMPQTDDSDISVSLTANAPAAYPRPISLQAAPQGESSATLSWQAAEGKQPTAYAIYRDGEKVGQSTETTYTDDHLTRGTYAYAVQALYEGDHASSLSDTTSVSINVGEPYFAPTSLTASLAHNKQVSLNWNEPSALLKHEASLRWDNGINDDAVGLTSGGYFFAAIALDADDLAPYRGMKIDKIQAFIKESPRALSARIYKDGKMVSNQRINTADIKYGEFNDFTLDTPVTIERGSTYYVALLITHDANLRPLGIHTATPLDGKSNLMSENGKDWYPISYVGYENTNFNIAAHLTPTAGYTEEEPTGYIVFRNGKRITPTAIKQLSYSEELTDAGQYTYSVASEYAGGHLSAHSSEAQVEKIQLDAPQAPHTLKADIVRNRKVNLRWDFPLAQTSELPIDLTVQAGITPEGMPEYVGQFKGTYAGEMGIASDGNYIYTTKYSAAGIINRYTMDGTFDTSFSVTDTLSTGFRNLIYADGHFYATANSSAIYQIDMDKRTVTSSISISEIARHIAYIPSLDNGRGGFEIGDWSTSIYTTMRGAKIGNGPTPKAAAGTAFYNGIIYSFEQGYEHNYELCAYDYATGRQLWHKSLDQYGIINPNLSASAGGMSIIETKEGLHLLALGLQEPAGTRFIYFDLGTVKGLSGYNVYRNNVKVNDAPLSLREYSEELSTPGTYTYQVETAYIDQTVSEKSAPVSIEVIEAGNGEAPTDVKARMASYGYDVNVSMIDPTSLSTDLYESFESEAADQSFAREGWTNLDGRLKVTSTDAVHGNRALTTTPEAEAELIIPVAKAYTSPFAFSFMARNTNRAEGDGEIQVLTSDYTTSYADFTNRGTFTTAEAWKQCDLTLPASTKYILIRVAKAYAAQLIDAISINSTKVGKVYGYDILRNGEKLNDEPVAGPSYTDHNVLPGTYTYQVRAYYDDSSISPLSEPVQASVSYTNGYQQPGTLSVTQTPEGNRLNWSVPALGGVTELRWHNGVCDNAAGLPSGGAYYAGVQWNSDELAPYSNLSISEVKFYINQVPDVLYVQLFEGDDLVFEKYVADLRQYSFNTVRLDKPIKVNTSKRLRAVIYVEHNQITVPLGYDAGPAQGGRGNLYSTDGVTWSTLSDNEIEGNWNITLCLQPYADNSKVAPTQAVSAFADKYVRHASTKQTLSGTSLDTPAATSFFDGYNIYCNGEKINAEVLSTSATQYLDAEKHAGRYYEYQVKAIYPGYGEVGSNVVRILTTGINDATVDDTNSADAPIYNIQGIRTNRSAHGPVIQNGKKRIQ